MPPNPNPNHPNRNPNDPNYPNNDPNNPNRNNPGTPDTAKDQAEAARRVAAGEPVETAAQLAARRLSNG